NVLPFPTAASGPHSPRGCTQRRSLLTAGSMVAKPCCKGDGRARTNKALGLPPGAFVPERNPLELTLRLGEVVLPKQHAVQFWECRLTEELRVRLHHWLRLGKDTAVGAPEILARAHADWMLKFMDLN